MPLNPDFVSSLVKASRQLPAGQPSRDAVQALNATPVSAQPREFREARREVAPDDSFDDTDYVPFGVDGLLHASERILAINRGLDDPDERDHIRYERLMEPHRMLGERIRLDAGKLRRNLVRRITTTRTLADVPTFVFDDYSSGLLVGNPLAQPLEEINPFQLIEQARSVTKMGPGGLGTEDAITEGAQNVHASQFGFISTVEGPESSLAGIDVRLAHGTKIGSDGLVYQKFKDRKTGKFVWLNPQQASELAVGLPD